MATITMTANWVKAVPSPASGREVWYDEKTKGLGLRVSPSGKKVWFVEYRVKGDRTKRNLTLDPFPQMTLADARERAKETLLAAGRGQDPGAMKQEEKGAPTFARLASEFIERYAKANKKSWAKDQWYLDSVILPALGKKKAFEIRRRDVVAVLEQVATTRGPVLANRTLALLRKIYNWGISRDLVEVNPCTQIGRVALEKQRERVLSEGEIRAVWDALDKQKPSFAAIFKLELITGQRGQEIRTMRWQDLDLENGWWTIPGVVTKNKLAHRVPLSRLARDILNAQRVCSTSEEWVFPGRTNRDQPSSMPRGTFQNVRDESGVTEINPHDLRRTAASLMTSMGIPRLVVQKILNHAETGVTAVYDRYGYDAEKREALDAWAVRLGEILVAPSRTRAP